MATLGNTTTPTWGPYGWIQQTAWAVAGQYTVPAGGGFFDSVWFWAATDGTPADYIWGVIWDASSGAVLAHGSGVLTSGGLHTNGNVGSQQWWNDPISPPIWIAGGTTVLIGWQPNSSSRSTDWAYNGAGSPTAVRKSMSGSPASMSGNVSMSPSGLVAAYATYTAGSIYGDDGSAFQGGVIAYADDGAAWQQCEVYVDDGSAWQRIG